MAQNIDDNTKFEWKAEVTNDDDLTYLVCGLRMTATETTGIHDLYFQYCKVNDFTNSKEKTVGTSDESCVNPILITKTIMCSNNNFVTGLGYKFESTSQGFTDGTIQGITQIVF